MDPSASSRRIVLTGVDGPPRPCVRLQRGDDRVSIDVYPTGDQLEGAAEATLDAIVQFLPAAVSLSLEQLHVLDSDPPVVVVIVVVEVAGVSLPHTGSAFVHDHPPVAAVKATLAAVNRRLEILGM